MILIFDESWHHYRAINTRRLYNSEDYKKWVITNEFGQLYADLLEDDRSFSNNNPFELLKLITTDLS